MRIFLGKTSNIGLPVTSIMSHPTFPLPRSPQGSNCCIGPMVEDGTWRPNVIIFRWVPGLVVPTFLGRLHFDLDFISLFDFKSRWTWLMNHCCQQFVHHFSIAHWKLSSLAIGRGARFKSFIDVDSLTDLTLLFSYVSISITASTFSPHLFFMHVHSRIDPDWWRVMNLYLCWGTVSHVWPLRTKLIILSCDQSNQSRLWNFIWVCRVKKTSQFKCPTKSISCFYQSLKVFFATSPSSTSSISSYWFIFSCWSHSWYLVLRFWIHFVFV